MYQRSGLEKMAWDALLFYSPCLRGDYRGNNLTKKKIQNEKHLQQK